MNQPEACPKCGEKLNTATSKKYPGQWHCVCSGCLWVGAYGDAALAEARRITAKLNHAFGTKAKVEDYRTKVQN